MVSKKSDKQEVIPNRRVDFIKPPEGIKHIYTNNFQIAQTVFDIRVIFGELTDINDERFEVTQRAHVTMSWLEAKALAESLSAFVRKYEEVNGPIKTEFPPVLNPAIPEIPKIINPT